MRPFKHDTRVTFLGDSITAGNNYTARIADYYHKNLPELRVKFACAGVSGASLGTALCLLEKDLLSTEPDCVTVLFGVNDSRPQLLNRPDTPERTAALEAAFDTYKQRMTTLLDVLTLRGIEVILCTPPPYAEFCRTDDAPICGANALLLRYAQEVRKIAAERGLELVDFHSWISELYVNEELYRSDRIHLLDAGHARMAECFIAAQGLPTRAFVPGEAAEPFSDEIAEWRALVSKQRGIYDVENMIIGDFSLTFDEKMAFIRDYIKRAAWGDRMFMRDYAYRYIENKPREAEIADEISACMDRIADCLTIRG